MYRLNKRRGLEVYALWLWGVLFLFALTGRAHAVKLYVEGSSVAPTKMVSSQRNAPLLKLRVYTDTSTGLLNSLKIKREGEAGTAADNNTDIKTATLYKDSNNNGIYDSVDVLMATSSYDGTYYTFTSTTPGTQLPRTIDTFGETYLVTYDMSPSATTNRTITALLESPMDVSASVTLSTLDYLGTPLYPVVSFASSTQTYVNPSGACDIGPVDSKCDAGQTKLTVTDATGLVDGDYLVIGTGPTKEIQRMQSAAGNVITLYSNLTYPHGNPEEVYKLKPTYIGNKLFVFGSDYATRAHPTEYKTFVIKPAAGTIEVFVDQLRFCNPSSTAVTVSSIKLARAGTASDADILNVKLYDDVNDNLATSGAAFLNSGPFSNGFVTINIPGGYVIPAGSCNIGTSPNYKAPAFKNLVVKFEIPSTASTDVKAGIGVFDPTYINAGSNTVVAFAAFMNPEDENDDCDAGSKPWPPPGGTDPYEPGDTRVLVDTVLDNINGILPSSANTTATLWEGFDCGSNQQKSVRRGTSPACYATAPSRGELELQGSNITCFDPLLPAENPPSWVVTWPNLYIRTDPFNVNAERIEIGSILDIAPPEYAAAYDNFATANAEQGKINLPVFGLKLSSQAGSVSVSKISLDMGTANAANTDVSLVRAYEDLNKNGAFDAGEALLASSSFDANVPALTTLTFIDAGGAPTPLVVQSGSPRYLVFTYNFTSSAVIGRTFSARLLDTSRVYLASNDQASINTANCGGGACSEFTPLPTIVGNSVAVNGVNLAPVKVKSGTNFVSFLQLQTSITSGSAIVDQIKVDFTNGADVTSIGIYDDSNGDGTTFSTTGADLLLGSNAGPFGASTTVDISAAPAANRTVSATAGLKNFLVALNILPGAGTPPVNDLVRASLANNTYLTLNGGVDTVDATGFPILSTTSIITNYDSLIVSGQGNTPPHYLPPVSGLREQQMLTLKMQTYSGDIDFRKLRFKVVLRDTNGTEILPGSATYLSALPDIIDVPNIKAKLDLNADAPPNVHDGIDCTGGFLPVNCDDPTVDTEPDPNNNEDTDLAVDTAFNYATGYIKFTAGSVIVYPDTPNGLKEAWVYIVFPIKSSAVNHLGKRVLAEVDFSNPDFAGAPDIEIFPGGAPPNDQIEDFGTLSSGEMIIGGNSMSMSGSSLTTGTQKVQQGEKFGVLKLLFSATGPETSRAVQLSKLQVARTGTATGTDVKMLSLFEDTNGNGSFDGADLLMSTTAFDAAASQYATFSTWVRTVSVLPSGTPQQVLLVYTTSGNATSGVTLGAEITNSSFLTVNSPDTAVVTSAPVASSNVTTQGNTVVVTGNDLAPAKINPATIMGTTTMSATSGAGATTVSVSDATGVTTGDYLRVGSGATQETRMISNVTGGVVSVYAAFANAHNGTGCAPSPACIETVVKLKSATLVMEKLSFTMMSTFNYDSSPELLPTAELTSLSVSALNSGNLNFMRIYRDNGSGTLDSSDRLLSSTGTFVGDVATFSPFNTLLESTLDSYTANNATLVVTDLFDGGRRFITGDLVVVDPDTTNEEKFTIVSVTKQTSTGKTILSLSAPVKKVHTVGTAKVRTYIQPGQSKELLVVFNVKDTAGSATTTTRAEITSGASIVVNAPDIVALSPAPLQSSLSTYRDFITVTPTNLAPTNVSLGQTGVPMLKLSALANTNSGTLNSVKIYEGGTSPTDTHASLVSVYKDANGNGLFDGGPADTLLGTSTFSSQNATVTLTPAQSIDTTTPVVLYAVYDITSSALATSYTLGARVSDDTFMAFTAPDEAATTNFPIASNAVNVLANDTLTVLTTDPNTESVAPLYAKPGDTNVPLEKISMSASSASITVNSIKVNKLGTILTSDVSSVDLFSDNGNGLYDAGDALIMSTTFDGTGLATFNTPFAVSYTQNKVLFVGVDIAGTAPANDTATIGVRVNSGNVTVALPDAAASYTAFQSDMTTISNKDALSVSKVDLAPAQITRGSSDEMLKLTMTAGSGSVTVTSVKVFENGSANAAADVEFASLYEDYNGDNLATSGELLSTTTFSAELATFTGLSLAVAAGTPRSFIVGYKIAASATAAKTVQAQLVNSTYVTVASPDVVSFAVSPLSSSTSVIIGNKLTVSLVDLAPAAMQQEANALMGQLSLSASQGTITVSSIKINESGTSVTDSHVEKAELILDANGNAAYDIGDSILASATFTSQNATFTGLSLAVTAGAPKKLLVQYAISSAATVGQTVAMTLTDISFVTVVSPDQVENLNFPMASSASTIALAAPDTLTVAAASLAPAQAYQGQTGVAMEKLTLTAAAKSVFLTGLTLTENGTSVVDADVSSVKIYKDDGDGNFNAASDSVIGSGGFSGQSATIALNDGGTGSLRVNSASAQVIYAVYDVSASAALSQTLGVRIADETKLTVTAPDTVVPFAAITSTDASIISPPDTLTITGTDLTAAYAGTVEQAKQDAGMLKLTLTAGSGSVTLTSLKIDEGGTSASDTDISSVRLFQDTGNGTLETGTDTLLGTGTFAAQSVTFGALSVAVASGTPQNLFVVYNISPASNTGVNINASVTAAGNVTVSFPDAVTATFPVKSNEVTIGGNTVTVAGTSVAPASVTAGQTGVAMEKLTFSVASGAATITQIKVDESGSSTLDSDISSVKLYLDEGNGNFDGTESLQLSTAFTSQTANIGAISIPISVGAPATVFIIYDISASSANGVDFKAKVADATYITVTTPDTVGSFTPAIESAAASLPDTVAPAAITTLSVSGGTAHGEIVLTWTAPGDDGSLAGTKATKYTIKRAASPISDETAWAAATTITNTVTPALQGAAETFTVSGLTECTTYYFAVKAEDEVPNLAGISNTPGAQPRDGQAPVITHTPQTAASANNGATTGITLTATLTDGCSISSATLYYRKTGDTAYVNTPLSLSGGSYSATIPQALITDNTAGIDYYLEAKDSGNNASTYPSTPPKKIGTFKAFAFAAPWSLKSIVISAADYGPVLSSPNAGVTQGTAGVDPETSVSLTANDPADTTPPVGYTGKYTLACTSGNTLNWNIKNLTETFNYPAFTAQCLNPSLSPQAISSMDGKLHFDVPENAVKEEVVVTVIPVDDIKVSDTPAKQLAKMPSYIPRQPEKLLFVGGSYQVGPYRYALEKQAQLTLLYEDSQLENLPESKLGLYAWDDEKLQWEYIGGTIQSEENKVTASTASFSTYRIILDNVPPDVKNFKPGDKDRYLTRTPEISADLSDLGSGVDPSTVTMYIDGSAVPVKVDSVKGRFVYAPEAPLAAGEHEITVVVRDKVGNETRLEKQKLLIPGDIKIERVFNAPNPVRSWGEIAFQYEVDEVNAKFFDIGGYSVTIEVYTLSGKRIALIEGNGLATKQKIGKYVRFRRKADEGVEIPHLSNGVYIFRLVARDFEGKTISKINKLVIAR